MAPVRKPEIVTFKAPADLLEAMKAIPNRSEFIRAAVLAALGNLCPVCGGTGILTPKQQAHWGRFAESHSVEECQDCHETHLVCERAERPGPGHGAAGGGPGPQEAGAAGPGPWPPPGGETG